MPVGPYETFSICLAAQIEIYHKKHPDWTPEHLKKVAGGVCYTIEQNMKGMLDAEDLTFLQGKLAEDDLSVDNVWNTHDVASERMNKYFDEYGKLRKAQPALSREDIWNLIAQTFKQAGHKYYYYASMHSPHQKDGKFFALFRVISTKPTGMTWPKGERWRPSYESLRKCLGSIFKAPLIGPPEEGHLATAQHGRPISWTMPNGYADVVFEIDKTAYDKLESGEWHDVSPQINPIVEHREGDIAVVDDWTFEHVAFVNKGAFDEVEALDWWQGDPKKWLALAAELQSHTGTDCFDPSLRLMTDGAPSLDPQGLQTQGADQTNIPKGGNQNMNDKNESSQTPEKAIDKAPDKELIKIQQDLEIENQRLQGEIAKRDQRLEILEHGQSTKTYQAEIERLKKNYDAINEKMLAKQAEEHAYKVRTLLDARVRAGLIDDSERVAEAKKYGSLSDDALDLMIDQWEVVATQVASGGPKAKFQAQKGDESLFEAVGRQLFGSSFLGTPKEEK
jgi:hypothetical protein